MGNNKWLWGALIVAGLLVAAKIVDTEEEDELHGAGEDLEDNEIDEEELEMGIDTEHEHTDSDEIAEKIAKDHLAEDEHYYSKLKEAGL